MKYVFILLLSLACSAFAEQAQISHTHGAKLHYGPNEYSKVVTELAPDTPVEVLGTNMQSGYALVKTKNKTKGWLKMANLERAANTKREHKPVNITQQTYHYLDAAKNKLDNINPHPKAKESKQQQVHLAQKTSLPKTQETAKIKSQNQIHYEIHIQEEERAWFITGAAVLAFGILIGLLIPTKKRRRNPY